MKKTDCLRIKTYHFLTKLAVRQVEKMVGKKQQVFLAFAEARNTYRKLVDAMIKILTEIALLDS